MSIKLPDGTILNNLEEQVEYNKKNIEKHFEVDRVLANFGIKIIGRVDTEADIATQTPPVGGYQYGDAYAVGLEGSEYDYYIYTRPFEGETADHWFNIGKLNIVGPQGPQGPQGEQGPVGEGSRIVSTTSLSALQSEYPANSLPEGSVAINTGGLVYITRLRSDGQYEWVYKFSIKGERGIQGPQGERGETGLQGAQGPVGPQGERGNGLVILGDDLTSIDQLPAPGSVRRDGGYLIVVDGVKHLYAIVGLGTTESPLRWEDLGVFAYTINAAPTKFYIHRMNVQIYPNSIGTDIYLPVTVINKSSARITPDTLYDELGAGKVSVGATLAYGNSHYHFYYDLLTTSDGESNFFETYSWYYDENYGISEANEYIYEIRRVYDNITEI